MAKWQVFRTIWPFADGWGVATSDRRTILETGLPTREAAQIIADAQNQEANG